MWGTAFRQPVLPGIIFQLIHYQEPGRRTKGAARFGCADVASVARSLRIVSREHDGVLFSRVRVAKRVQERGVLFELLVTP
jgi:hypothetical protein